jgi:K(+)-stimulated pyrophosphate-energized sodium pump
MFGLNPFEQVAIWSVLGIAILGLLYAILLRYQILKEDKGTARMLEVWDAIREGADAYLRGQLRIILPLIVILTLALFASVFIVPPTPEAAEWYCMAFKGASLETAIECGHSLTMADEQQVRLLIGIGRALAFVMGAGFSLSVGQIGMRMAVQANVRVASAARRSFGDSLRIAYRAGTITGMLTDGLGLFGGTIIFILFGIAAPDALLGFGFGGTLVALFMRVGGGIFTKAADVGADLVGKVEAGLVEDDPRNPAVIADLVGDNVGDCAGRGADLFESTAAENIGAMILGVAAFLIAQTAGWPNPEAWIFFPLVVRAFGLLATIVALYFVRGREDEDPMKMLNRGYWVTTALSVVGLGVTTFVMMQTGPQQVGALGLPTWVWMFFAGIVGLATSVVFVYITQYYTAGAWRPVKEIAEASRTGPATNIISGFAVGLETTFATALTISAALLLSAFFGMQAFEGTTDPGRGAIFGTAVATMGMLMTTAYILAMDTFGPITDNAGGIAEFSRSEASAREITDRLDAVGNTTKALTKGYAIASASLAAFLLFSAYIDKVNLILAHSNRPTMDAVNLANVPVFVAAFLGAMLVFFFSALAIRAVGKAAQAIIVEVRRQFREMPGIMDYSQRPDYARVVDITTQSALREMVLPGVVAVATPIIVGVLLGHEAVAGLLMVGTIAGVLLATVLNNGGGAWDNAKKYIESGQMLDESGQPLRKGSPAHAAAVVGDTVGDPFKDTAGPSLHVLVKLLATITLVLAPLFIR